MKIVLIICCVLLSRLAPHPANFTVIGALALLAGHNLVKDSRLLWASVGGMLVADLILGFHSTVGFVYLGFLLAGLMSFSLSRQKNRFFWPVRVLSGSLIFFLVSNFGVWLVDGFYPMTMSGLGASYLAGLPFLKNQLLGDIVWTTGLGFAMHGLSKLQGGRNETNPQEFQL